MHKEEKKNNGSKAIALRENPKKNRQDRMQRAQSEQKIRNFTPVLSKKSLEIAKYKAAKDKNYPKVEDRLLLKEKQRIEKLENEIFLKKKCEKMLFDKDQKKNTRKINDKFYEQQLKYVKDTQESRNVLKMNIHREKSLLFTFKPNLCTKNNTRSRSPMQTIQELYAWNQQKMINKEKVSKKDEFELKLQMTKPTVLKMSHKMHKKTISEGIEKEKIAATLAKNISPYWPNK